ncbi:M24 family metallopeptidase [Lactobacillus acetotolerans]|uniref:Aminopeptidase P family protein n=1 Tax=Lactobacillus acetotolerans TaxID=1600 RepID=A0A5P5ZHC9_9LACO|nr:Xaa-Pro peptidase family protein [Lactobacillus acetotolerans]QFG50758.1 aminopeptidase P family protein [Lactobacillus acetotolerans]GGV17007.1 peptidase M24 [Lactobacillus acetotolerans DSM 20749 = JCM 3825]
MHNERLKILRRMMQQNGLDAILITSQANRYYISNFTGTYARVIVDLHSQYVIADGRYFYQLKEQSPDFEIIDDKMQISKTIADFVVQKDYKTFGVESKEMNVEEYLAIKENTNTKIIPTSDFIEHLRMIKDPTEKQKIEKADEISAKAFEHIKQFIHPGLTEKEVANELDNYGLKLGADSRAFETIVASGLRSSLPHGHASQKIIQNNEPIIIDFGFKVDHYYSDVTRTIHLGKVKDQIHDIYEIDREAQQKAIETCEIGKPLKEIDAAARTVISKYGYGKYFLHGLGHGIGLTVHEYPLLNQSSSAVMKAGMTFTAEPGIYVENVGGVRIEDDLFMGEDNKAHQLTHITKEWDQLES